MKLIKKLWKVKKKVNTSVVMFWVLVWRGCVLLRIGRRRTAPSFFRLPQAVKLGGEGVYYRTLPPAYHPQRPAAPS